jgi:tetratricopeptide (TPR) repeat protein
MKLKGLQSAAGSGRAGKLGSTPEWTGPIQLQSAKILRLDHEYVWTVAVVLVFVTFLPALQHEFIDSGGGDSKIVLTGAPFGSYHPILWSSFALDHGLWWMDPFGYHLTSLLLHVVNAVIVYSIASLLLSYARVFESSNFGMPEKLTALSATLLFAIHPLRVEAVAWVSARAELLSTLWGLLGIYGYLRAKAETEAQPHALSFMRFSIVAYACSLLSGPSGFFLPIIFLLLDGYPLHRAQRFPSLFRVDERKLYYEKTPYALIAACATVVSLLTSGEESAVMASYAPGMVERILHQLAAPAFFLWKFALPLRLSPAYELNGSAAAAFAATSIFLGIGALAAYRRWRACATAWFCYVVFLLAHYRPDVAGQQLLADRSSYFAMLPWSIVAGAALVRWSVVSSKDKKRRSALGAAIAAGVVAACAFLTRYQLPMWRDAETLWKTSAVATGGSQAFFSLALVSESQGKLEDAVAHYRRAAELNPQRWDAHERAADLLQQRGNIHGAAEHYRRVAQLQPRALKPREHLAAGLVNLGNIPEAVKHFRALLDLAPERNDVRVKLGTILAVEGRVSEAADLFRIAAEAEPGDGRHFLRLGQVLAAQGKLPEAVENFRKAVRLRPEDFEAHESLGKALAELGAREEAAVHLREALRILRSTPSER